MKFLLALFISSQLFANVFDQKHASLKKMSATTRHSRE